MAVACTRGFHGRRCTREGGGGGGGGRGGAGGEGGRGVGVKPVEVEALLLRLLGHRRHHLPRVPRKSDGICCCWSGRNNCLIPIPVTREVGVVGVERCVRGRDGEPGEALGKHHHEHGRPNLCRSDHLLAERSKSRQLLNQRLQVGQVGYPRRLSIYGGVGARCVKVGPQRSPGHEPRSPICIHSSRVHVAGKVTPRRLQPRTHRKSGAGLQPDPSTAPLASSVVQPAQQNLPPLRDRSGDRPTAVRHTGGQPRLPPK